MKLSKQKAEIATRYNLLNSDMVFCELVLAGWSKYEAAFYAYHLLYEEESRIKAFLKKKMIEANGIEQYLADVEEKRNSAEAELEARIESERQAAVSRERKRLEIDMEKRLNEKLDAAINTEVERRIRERDKKMSDDFVDIGNKDTMRSELVRLYNQISDPKLRLDYAKQIMSLDQMQKEQSREIDDRIHFHTSSSCKYCDRCKTCELKEFAESEGCRVVPKSTSPYIWTIEKTEQCK